MPVFVEIPAFSGILKCGQKSSENGKKVDKFVPSSLTPTNGYVIIVIGDFNMKKLVRYVNEETGEYHEKEYNMPTYYNQEGYLYRNKSLHIKSFCDRPLPEQFTHAEIGKLSIISYYIGRDQIIGYKSGNLIKPHTVATISRLLKQSDKNTRRLLKKAKEFNIIREVVINGEKYYMYNPLYKLAVKRVSLTVYIAFQDMLSHELPEWVIRNYLSDIKEFNDQIMLID